jgi:rRNA maturation endonuclease Nob1
MFIDGVPEDNNFRFCPYCGHPLQQMLLDESPEEYEEEDTCDAP